MEHGVEAAPPSPFEKVLLELGNRHEKDHLASLPDLVDLSNLEPEEREQRTMDEVKLGSPGVYQARFRYSLQVGGRDCQIVGEPDFLIRGSDGYIIRDSKMSQRITAKDHPEIVLQLNLYGWLFERTLGMAPGGLQVHNGVGEITDLPYEGGHSILEPLERLVTLKISESEPVKAVGWTKCSNCGFRNNCWEAAWNGHHVATIGDVDEGLALKLSELDIRTYTELLDSFDSSSLSELKRPYGKGERRVGKAADRILLTAQSILDGDIRCLQQPGLPTLDNWVMFDLEGMPAYLDCPSRIYLWGMQVFGANPSLFKYAASEFGEDGDRLAWQEFLRLCKAIFGDYGEIKFVHWASYEKTALNKYIEKYGDADGTGEEVLASLLDLYPLVKKSVILPLPSYSLKAVEKFVGYERSQDEYGGNWAMAQFIRATETNDEKLRDDVMNSIIQYNQEDLEATWAVFEWFRNLTVLNGPRHY